MLWQESPEFRNTFYDLPMTFLNVHTNLSNTRIGCGELSECVCRNRKLAHAKEADAELRNGEYPARKLADCYYSLGRYRSSIRPVFERNMEERQAKDGNRRLVFETPTVPLLLGRVGRAALGAGDGLLGNFSLAFSAGPHEISLKRSFSVRAPASGPRSYRSHLRDPEQVEQDCL